MTNIKDSINNIAAEYLSDIGDADGDEVEEVGVGTLGVEIKTRKTLDVLLCSPEIETLKFIMLVQHSSSGGKLCLWQPSVAKRFRLLTGASRPEV